MQRYWYLRNMYLLSGAFALTSIQVVRVPLQLQTLPVQIMLIIWTAISDWRPRRVDHNSNDLAGFACGSRTQGCFPKSSFRNRQLQGDASSLLDLCCT